jgi:citrate lyase beta subunit
VRTSLDGSLLAGVLDRLSEVDNSQYAGDAGDRQPVHTCYVPADQVTGDVAASWGAAALSALEENAPRPGVFAALFGLSGELAEVVHAKVCAKLADEPVEDLRIDFEDGYGVHADEDGDAVRCAELAAGWTSPPVGIRFKSLDTRASAERGLRTLDLFVTAYGRAPMLTLPKVTDVAQVAALVDVLSVLEERLGLGTLRFEIQVETARSIVDGEGRLAIPRFVAAGGGRVSGLHFGTYDYTAACGLSAAEQHLAHPACDFARHVMQVSAAGTGVRLSDGSSNVLPVGDAVGEAWRTHFGLVLRSLGHGFFQGWDMHPAQLVTRYAANYVYYLRNVGSDARRLRAYVDSSASGVLDEPATAQALAMSLRRAVDCGALSATEMAELTGLAENELAALSRREKL